MQLRFIVICALFCLGVSPAFAQTAVDVGGSGVKVKAGGTEVEAGPGGVAVKTPGATVTVEGEIDEDGGRPAAAPASSSTRKETLVCKDNEELELSNLTIDSATLGLVASGNCELKITNATIKAKQQAVKLTDNATVTFVNVVITGKKGAFDLRDNATLTIENCTVTGKIVKKDNATLEKKGKNKLSKG